MGRDERQTGERERVDVLAIVGEGHIFLPQADGVLPLRYPVVLFELGLGDALE